MSNKVMKQFFNIFRKNMNYEKCFCPDDLKYECSKKISRAHTVSKSSNLKIIADNNHVYAIENSPNIFFKKEFSIPFKLIGINQASTFTIFCSKHDSEFFKDFELNVLVHNIWH